MPEPPVVYYYGCYPNSRDTYLSIANGGAGQSGFIGRWADAFIDYSVQAGSKPFRIAWHLADTTESLKLVAAGSVDVGVTYNPAAELESMRSGASIERVYGFRDHFLLVGPQSNPAGLDPICDDIFAMFNKIVSSGNADVTTPPSNRPPTKFLSRFDKSATNIKESSLFASIGQTPWALPYSTWYHQYPGFPREALKAAAKLSEYTLTDRGTWLSSPSSVTHGLEIYKAGTDHANDPLLLPAHVLLSGTARAHTNICQSFMQWVVSKNGGQQVVEEFKIHRQIVYSPAP